MWRTRSHRNRKGERGSFSKDDYIAFLDPTHQRLRAPIMLIWDNLNPRQRAGSRTDLGSELADRDPVTRLRPGPQPDRGRLAGLGYGDIAKLLDIPDGTVKSRNHEARRLLHLRLNDHR